MVATPSMLKIISNIAKSVEGRDFVSDVLTPMLHANHTELLLAGKESRDELIGEGHALLALVGFFNKCDIRLSNQASKDVATWG